MTEERRAWKRYAFLFSLVTESVLSYKRFCSSRRMAAKS